MKELTEFEKFIILNHPDPDSITMMENELIEPEWPKRNPKLALKRIGLEWDVVIKLAEDYYKELMIHEKNTLKRKAKGLKCSCCGKPILKHQLIYGDCCMDGSDGDL